MPSRLRRRDFLQRGGAAGRLAAAEETAGKPSALKIVQVETLALDGGYVKYHTGPGPGVDVDEGAAAKYVVST